MFGMCSADSRPKPVITGIDGTPDTAGIKYGYWRTDKPKMEGYSHELIGAETEQILNQTDLDSLDAVPFPGVDTMYKALHRTVQQFPNSQAFGTRVGNEYQWITWREATEMAENLSYGIKAMNLAPAFEAEGTMHRMIGVQSKNRVEWVLTNIAGMYQKVTTVALYDTLGAEAMIYISNQTELSTIALTRNQIENVVKMRIEDQQGENKLAKLENLLIFDESTAEDKVLASTAGLQLVQFNDVVEKGKQVKAAGESSIDEVGPNDIMMLSYTSGTTGNPKGVKLTHKMLINEVFANLTRNQADPFTEHDRYISYLPAAHVFEHVLQGVCYATGMKTGFYQGDQLKLIEDCQLLKPTFFPSVPRLYNKIYGMLQGGIKSATGIKGWLVNTAVAAKLENYRNGQGVTHMFYDKVVFQKFRNILGGEVRRMVTGSAPISAEVLDFLKICFCCQILEAYGMTETTGGASIQYLEGNTSGHVGGPLQCNKFCLRDVPEMNYFSTDEIPKGEICMWGPNITPGYFRNQEKTDEALKNGGWLHSGDVGKIDKNGRITIIDRVKNIFKLSQGEYIAPEKLENVYVQSPFVAQCWIHGDSLRDYAIGFFVMDEMYMKKYCAENNCEFNDDLMKDETLRMKVYQNLMDLAKANKFNSLEKPKQILLLKDQFTVESDILTPTMKLKRNIAQKQFEEQIKTLYEAPVISMK